MTKEEFAKLHGTNSDELKVKFMRDLTELLNEERKDSKIDGFRIALALYDRNTYAFRAILNSLINAAPPVDEEQLGHFLIAGGQLKFPKMVPQEQFIILHALPSTCKFAKMAMEATEAEAQCIRECDVCMACGGKLQVRKRATNAG